ncbi:MFS transporter [Lysinibacter cavernae]|uniref:Putative proline/betaine transporter n=1 Tax=Lysinibacter cavernae TaxID=1640652 RepID=A0A7X5TS81_9MICO|nr:MFS transporter [Lysinibacter cavernae]NIH53196.1 MFS family permease [Lysinibacter cavernae]
MVTTATPDTLPQDRARRSTIAAFVGTSIEWYDFYIFGTASALVFAPLFFPGADPVTGLLASFATFWVGFIARPIGGVIFGHLGDRLGRKNVLVTTLLLMGVATTIIGLLPTFETIGIAAPIILVLCRALQGIAVGGEWGGAVLLATENSTELNKGKAGMWVQQGSPVGSILATATFAIAGFSMSNEAFMAWGWRIPFLLSAVLVIVGLVIRLKVEESADFAEVKKTNEVVKVPLATLFGKHTPLVLLGIGASAIGISSAYFTNTFALSWTTSSLGVDRGTMLMVLFCVSILQFIVQPFAPRFSQRLGRTRFMATVLGLNIVMVVPMFLLILTGNPILIGLGLALSIATGASYYAMLSSFLADVFPANIRYTGVSVSYQVCGMLIGGSTPLIAQLLLSASGGTHPWFVAAYYTVLIVLTLVSVLALSKRMSTAKLSLNHI